MTIQGLGWSDELSNESLRAVIGYAENELNDLAEHDIELGPPIVKGEALVLAATPTDYLNDMRNRLRLAAERALGQPAWTAAEQAQRFLPHVSVAYARFDADAAPYAAALRTVSPATVQVQVKHVALIRQERQLEPHWRYIWEELARVPLGMNA